MVISDFSPLTFLKLIWPSVRLLGAMPVILLRAYYWTYYLELLLDQENGDSIPISCAIVRTHPLPPSKCPLTGHQTWAPQMAASSASHLFQWPQSAWQQCIIYSNTVVLMVADQEFHYHKIRLSAEHMARYSGSSGVVQDFIYLPILSIRACIIS